MNRAKKFPPFQTANLLTLLFERARSTLTSDDLDHIGDHAASHADWLISNAADLADALGCQLVGESGDMPCHEVATALFHFVDVMREAVAIQEIGRLARPRPGSTKGSDGVAGAPPSPH